VSEQVLQNIAAGREWVTRAHASLSPEQKTFLVRGLPALLLVLGIGAYFLNYVAFRPLFSNLSPQDAAAVVRELDARRIPYHLRNNGSVIEVPEEILYHTRLE
jgi:flagellar M-ring protein FliF